MSDASGENNVESEFGRSREGVPLNALDDFYLQLLHFGVVQARNDTRLATEPPWERRHADLDFIHNIPDLIGAREPGAHDYFWDVERPLYLERLRSFPEDDFYFFPRFVESLLEEMAPLIEQTRIRNPDGTVLHRWPTSDEQPGGT